MRHLSSFTSTVCLLFALTWAPANAQGLQVLAAENFYGDLAQQIGGPDVQVVSVLLNPEQDPHLFEASASTARLIKQAQLVVYNGIHYDPWMEKLLKAAKSPNRKVLVAAELTQHRAGDNPHLWYDPANMMTVAKAIARELQTLDPAHGAAYASRLGAFLQSMEPLTAKITAFKAKYAGLSVTATEPVFGYMAQALGLQMRNSGFQLAIMNDTEPRVSDVIQLEQDLRTRRVRVLFFNSQASNRSALKIQKLALASKIPVVGVTETLPAGKHYQNWMLDQISTLESSLEKTTP
jgi:zinc/manganese transport system substrate-binding protein